MKPIAIFRHVDIEGPGYLATFLDERDIPWQLIAIDAGDAVPQDISAYSALVFMGGPMSVNDDLPWIPKAEALIRDAVAQDIPLLGHCLGGQLITKAIGSVVSRNPVKEIGWGEVTVSDNDVARKWFGEVRNFPAFHWHGETFTLPHGAAHLLSSVHCANQAYAIGKHLVLQCHIEMTAEMIVAWCAAGEDEMEACYASPGVQSVSSMLQHTSVALPHMSSVAEQLYSCWINGVNTEY